MGIDHNRWIKKAYIGQIAGQLFLFLVVQTDGTEIILCLLSILVILICAFSVSNKLYKVLRN